MKNKLIVLLLVCLSNYSFAQLTKGGFAPSFSLDLGYDQSSNFYKSNSNSNTTNVSENSRNSFGFTPGIGYNLSSKFQLGMYFTYYLSKQLQNYNSEDGSGYFNENSSWETGFKLLPYVRYYCKLNEKFSLYFEGELCYSKSTTSINNQYRYSNLDNITTNDYKIDSYAALAIIKPGIQLNLGKIGLDLNVNLFNLGYRNSNINDNNENNIYFSSLIQSSTPLTIGVRYSL